MMPIPQGEFAPLKTWLNAKIHAVGSLHTNGDELMKAVTGHPLDPSVFLDYLKTKYTALYKLPATNP
jgi:carboxypeptidase Taq